MKHLKKFNFRKLPSFQQYLKVGNAICTTIALVGLKDCGLHQEVCQLALKMVGGLEVLLNILRTSNLRCNVSSVVLLNGNSNIGNARIIT